VTPVESELTNGTRHDARPAPVIATPGVVARAPDGWYGPADPMEQPASTRTEAAKKVGTFIVISSALLPTQGHARATAGARRGYVLWNLDRRPFRKGVLLPAPHSSAFVNDGPSYGIGAKK